MPDLDVELVERVARWCAEAGRPTVSAEIRLALGDLGWDELLAVRALLADPPPAQPLGPFALADLARGVPVDAAAERERGGEYPGVPGDGANVPAHPAQAEGEAPARPSRKAAQRPPRSPGIVIRRARDAVPPPPPPARSAPLLDELFLPEGRAVLERLIRRQGARRHAILAALAEGWRTPDGRPLADADLERLLDQHGLARAFGRREHDELLHALRAAGGLRAAAAARLGLERDAFDAALARAGAAAEAEKIREARRAEVRAKATLAERVRLLLADPARLEDLGVLAEVEDDLRRRLPEHVRAVGAAGGPLRLALARSLSISPAELGALAARLGLSLDGAPPRSEPAARSRRAGEAPPGAMGGLRPPRRSTAPRGPSAARPDERRPRGRGAPGRPPERAVPGRASGRPRTFGKPRAGAGRSEGSFGPPRPEIGRRSEGSFGPPRERRDRGPGSGPRGPRPAGAGGPEGRRRGPTSSGRAGPGRTGRPGPRTPGGPGSGRGRPPPRGPRRG